MVEEAATPVQDVSAVWEKIRDVWTIKEITEETDFRERGHPLRKWRFVYADFVPNARVPKELFTVDALELPDNSRILDQRPNAPTRSYHYKKDRGKEKTGS